MKETVARAVGSFLVAVLSMLIVRNDELDSARAADEIKAAREDGAAAKGEATAASDRANGLQVQLDAANKARKADRKEIERLNAINRPRVLTEQHKTHLHNLLHGRIRGPVQIAFAESLGKEGYLYSKQVKEFLESEGFECKPKINVQFAEIPLPGIGVAIADKQRVPAHANGLQHAFKTAGLGGEGTFAPMPEDEVRISIGTRLELSNESISK